MNLKLLNQRVVINGKSINVNDTAALEREISKLRANAGKTAAGAAVHYNVDTSLRNKGILAVSLQALGFNPVVKENDISFVYNGASVTASPAADGAYAFKFHSELSAAAVKACCLDIIRQYGDTLRQSVYDTVVKNAEAANLKLVEESAERDKTRVLVFEMRE